MRCIEKVKKNEARFSRYSDVVGGVYGASCTSGKQDVISHGLDDYDAMQQ
jgi:hypothetical protein